MEKRKLNRFNGLTEEEVKKNTLPDYLEPDLDLVFLGINPSLMAAHKGRYYAGPGNHFYKLLHASNLVPRFVNFEEDCNLLQYKIGLTNIVGRATRSSADLTTAEIRKGCDVVVEKMKVFRPKIAIFNGKCIYQVFSEKFRKNDFHFGLQSEKIGDTAVWVVPSSSARCSNFPRMEDKLHFYQFLKKHLMYLKGETSTIDPSDFIFKPESRPKVCKGTFVVKEILGGPKTDEKITLNSDEGIHQRSVHFSGEKTEKNRVKTPERPVIEETSNPTSDFMGLIKRRISEKTLNAICQEPNANPPKKLKYSNLKLRKT